MRCPPAPGRPVTHSFRAVVTGSEMVEDGMTAKPGGGLLTGTDRPGGGGGFFNSTTELKPEGSTERAGIRAPTDPCLKPTPVPDTLCRSTKKSLQCRHHYIGENLKKKIKKHLRVADGPLKTKCFNYSFTFSMENNFESPLQVTMKTTFALLK